MKWMRFSKKPVIPVPMTTGISGKATSVTAGCDRFRDRSECRFLSAKSTARVRLDVRSNRLKSYRCKSDILV